ncbi:hypothetical protein SH2C18_26260 [Clostridium sediminicola]|uniref:hypothetical protein n=1 Tax=Clostridium sediminicola TaxID=3114879 RepID=UPI0031F25742
MKRKYNLKKTLSMKMFIAEFGEDFSEHIKERLLDLEVRGVLKRKDPIYSFNLKNVEHTKYNCKTSNGLKTTQKEYAFGQFKVIEGELYFSEKCTESDRVMQAPIVESIYNKLDGESIINDEGCNAKKIDDSNVDFVVDSILSVCPDVSQEYLDIIKHMSSY